MDGVCSEDRGGVTICDAIEVRLEIRMGDHGQTRKSICSRASFEVEPLEILSVGIVLKDILQNSGLNVSGIASLLVEVGEDHVCSDCCHGSWHGFES
jgi:hypothetical protein